MIFPNIRHRGPTHSIIMIFLLCAPFLFWNIRRALPYFGVLASHVLIGDYFTGKSMIFWPLSTQRFQYFKPLRIGSMEECYLELALFGVFLGSLFLFKEYHNLLNSQLDNLLMIIPLGAIILSLYIIMNNPFPSRYLRTLLLPNLLVITMIFVNFLLTIKQIGTRLLL